LAGKSLILRFRLETNGLSTDFADGQNENDDDDPFSSGFLLLKAYGGQDGAAGENEGGISFKMFTLFTLLNIKHLNVYTSFTNRLQPSQVIEY
jgi:hypothetical protein